MKYIYAFLTTLLVTAFCGCTAPANISQFNLSEPIPVEVTGIDNKFYIPINKMVKADKDFFIFYNPENRPYSLTSLALPKLEPFGIYRFSVKGDGMEKAGVNINYIGMKAGAVIDSHAIFRTVLLQNTNGWTSYSKEFAVAPEVEKSYFNIGIYMVNGSKVRLGNLFLFDDFLIERVGSMRKADDKLANINFADEYDFSRYSDGDFAKIHKGSGENAKVWSNVKANIVTTSDGFKCLEIVRKDGNYIYPYIRLRDFTVNPQYYFVKVSVTARGSGKFRTGLWWSRPALDFDYENNPEFELSEKWQTFTMLRPCLSAGTKSAALAFTSNGEGTFYIRDIKVSLY